MLKLTWLFLLNITNLLVLLDAYEFPEFDEKLGGIDWHTHKYFTKALKQKLVQHNYLPSKGIPKTIYATGPFEPPTFRSLNEKYAPSDMKYEFLNYKQLDESMYRISSKLEKIGIAGVYQAFKAMRSRAFRADMWRWLILWENGGIYMDAKFFFTESPEWIDWENEQLIICAENGAGLSNRVCNGFIVMTQYHPVALAYIKTVVKNINMRLYPGDMLHLTGPGLVSRILQDSNMVPKPHRCELKHIHYDFNGQQAGVQEIWKPVNKFDVEQNCYYDKGQTIQGDCMHTDSYLRDGIQEPHSFSFDAMIIRASRKNEQYGDIWLKMKHCNGCNDYGDLFRAYQVYCDEPGEDCDIEYEEDNDQTSLTVDMAPFSSTPFDTPVAGTDFFAAPISIAVNSANELMNNHVSTIQDQILKLKNIEKMQDAFNFFQI